MRNIMRNLRFFDIALVAFLVVVGVMTRGAERPPRPELPAVIIRMQESVGMRIRSVFSPPVSTWVSGLLLGDDRAFSPELKEAFRCTGTSHLTAVSGYNIAVLISILASASGSLPVSRRARILGGIAMVTLFVLLTGAPASVIRAAGMAGIALAGRLLGRPVKTVRALMLALSVMVALKPELLLYDLGFQLSALATFGLVVFSPPLQSVTERYVPRALAEPVAQTVAATVTVSPLIASTFGTFSLITLPANVMLSIMVPFMMAASAVLLALGFVAPSAAQMLASLFDPVMRLPLRFISLASEVPHAELVGLRASCASLGLSIVVLALSILHQRRSPHVKED